MSIDSWCGMQEHSHKLVWRFVSFLFVAVFKKRGQRMRYDRRSVTCSHKYSQVWFNVVGRVDWHDAQRPRDGVYRAQTAESLLWYDARIMRVIARLSILIRRECDAESRYNLLPSFHLWSAKLIPLPAFPIILGTYNVNGRLPKEDPSTAADLKQWLYFPSDAAPDIYAIG